MKYFIVFNFTLNGNIGWSNCEMQTAGPIKTIQDVRLMESSLTKRLGYKNIILVSYRKF